MDNKIHLQPVAEICEMWLTPCMEACLRENLNLEVEMLQGERIIEAPMVYYKIALKGEKLQLMKAFLFHMMNPDTPTSQS